MIARPTTDALIADCCRELTEHILPALGDETLRARLAMTEMVLRNAAVRAAHEIAWLRDETAALCSHAAAVAHRHAGSPGTPHVTAAIAALEAGPRDSLHLADVVTCYELAGRAFELALGVAQDAGATELVVAARELLRARVDTEKRVMAAYGVVGR